MTARRALVIGIDQYDDPWKLNGCVNDARVMADLLREKFDFPQDGVTLLTDRDATKDAILDAFDDLIDATKTDDVVVLYYAGHGSRLSAMEKAAKASGYTTGLCPVDVTHPGPELYYLVDDEIHERLLDLAERTSYITVIVDACHSGTVTRDVFGDKVRNMAASQAVGDGFTLHSKPRRSTRPPDSSVKGPSGWVSLSDNYVLIAGCRDEEVANEFSPPDSEEKHGALTYFLAQELTNAHSGMTYRDVLERVAANVTARKPLQHPQMEGRIDRALFGVSELLPMDFARVLSRTGDRVTLNRGAAHGVTVGSTYDVYAQGTKRMPAGDDRTTLLTSIEIVSVGAVQSVARITAETAPDVLLPDSRAFETSHARGSLSVAVEIVGANDASDLATLEAELARSPIVEVVSPERPATPFARAYLIGPRVSVNPGDPVPQLGAVGEPTWAVVGTGGQLLMPTHLAGEEAVIRENLEQIARYTQALELENPNPRSTLRGKFVLEVMRHDANNEWSVATPDPAGGLPVFDDGDAFAFRVTSTHDQAVYIAVLDFQENYAIAPLFPPTGAVERIEPKRTFQQGVVPPGDRDEWRLQGSFVGGLTEQRETIKLFATSTPADFSMLGQTGTRGLGDAGEQQSPLTALFRMAIGTTSNPVATNGTRAVVKARVAERDPDDWTTVTASFIVRQKPTLAIKAEPTRVTDDGATIAGNGVAGSVSINIARTGGASSSYSVDALGAAVEDSGGRVVRTIGVNDARVTAGTRDLAPTLELNVPAGPDEAHLLVHTDEDGIVTFHFPDDAGTRAIGGGGGVQTFRVPMLPGPVAPMPGTRDALSAISGFASNPLGSQFLTLIVYPVIGGVIGKVGEDIVQSLESSMRPYLVRSFTPHNYRSESAPALDAEGWKQLSSDRGRALLLLHDTLDRSSGAFASMPREVVADLDMLYGGRVFAFDHLTLSHDPRRNAKALLDAIKLPANTTLDVDILAHGRGGLVARALVEGGSDTLAGIERLRVRKVIFAGTPHGGTPFADIQNIDKTLNRYTMLASATLTQFAGPVVGALFIGAKSVVFGAAAQLKGVSAMKPASVFLDSLKTATATLTPDRTPRYFAIASDFEPQEPGLVRRLRKLLADKTITGAHDLIVSTKSALDLPSRIPLVASQVLTQTDGVPHSSYVTNGRVHTKILEWLRSD